MEELARIHKEKWARLRAAPVGFLVPKVSA